MKNHFLIVDDDALVRRATARLVEHVTGCEVDCCAGGEEALRMVKEGGAFTCVVTDFQMPGMNGLELGSRLRALVPGLKMLLVTGSPGSLNEADVQQCGFDEVLPKPFDLAAMEAALRRMLPALEIAPVRHIDEPGGGGASFFERSHGIFRAFV